MTTPIKDEDLRSMLHVDADAKDDISGLWEKMRAAEAAVSELTSLDVSELLERKDELAERLRDRCAASDALRAELLRVKETRVPLLEWASVHTVSAETTAT